MTAAPHGAVCGVLLPHVLAANFAAADLPAFLRAQGRAYGPDIGDGSAWLDHLRQAVASLNRRSSASISSMRAKIRTLPWSTSGTVFAGFT